MTRINALSMPMESDFSRARQQYEEFKKFIEGSPIKVPFAGPTSASATAGTNAPTAGAPVNTTASASTLTGGVPNNQTLGGTFAISAPAQPLNFSPPPGNLRNLATAGTATINQLIQQGGTELFRGESSAQFAGNLRRGQPWTSSGDYGSGLYASSERYVAERYSEKDPERLNRMVLRPGSKVVTGRDINDEHDEWMRTLSEQEKSRPSNLDIGAFAKSRGYAAIRDPGNSYFNVVDPSAVVVEHGPSAMRSVQPVRPFDRDAYADRLAAQARAGDISIAQMARATSAESLKAEEKVWNQTERTRVRDETRLNRETERNAAKFERDSQRANDLSINVEAGNARGFVRGYNASEARSQRASDVSASTEARNASGFVRDYNTSETRQQRASDASAGQGATDAKGFVRDFNASESRAQRDSDRKATVAASDVRAFARDVSTAEVRAQRLSDQSAMRGSKDALAWIKDYNAAEFDQGASAAANTAEGQRSMMRELGQARREGRQKFTDDQRQRSQVEERVGAGIRERATMHAERFAAGDEARDVISGVQDEAQELYNTRRDRRTSGVSRGEGPEGNNLRLSGLLMRGLAIHGYTRLSGEVAGYFGGNQLQSIANAYGTMGENVSRSASESIAPVGTIGGFVGQALNATAHFFGIGETGGSGRANYFYDANVARQMADVQKSYLSTQAGNVAMGRARVNRAQAGLVGSSGLGGQYAESLSSEELEINLRYEEARAFGGEASAGYLDETASLRTKGKRTREDIISQFREGRDQLTYRSSIATDTGRGNEYAAGATEMASRQRSELFQAERDTKDLPGADRISYMQNLRGAQTTERQAFSDQVVRRADIQLREQSGMTAGAALSRQGYYEQGGEAQIRAKYGAQIWGVDTSNPRAFQQIQGLIAARTEDLAQNKLNERRRQIGVSGEIAGLQSEYNRNPLQARLDAFKAQRDAEIAGKDPSTQAAKDIESRYGLQVKNARQQYGDETRNIDRSISGERKALADYLHADSPAAGRRISDLDRMYTGEINEAARLQQAGRSDKAKDYLKNTELKFDVYEKDFLNSFRAEQFDFRRMSGTNRRDQEDPGEVLKTIAQKVTDVEDAIKSIVSGDQL